MPLDLVQDRHNERRIKMIKPRRDAAGQQHVAGFIHTVFQHTVLVIQRIQLFTNSRLFLFCYNRCRHLYLDDRVNTVVKQNHERKVLSGYRKVTAESLGMHVILKILNTEPADFRIFQMLLKQSYLFNSYLHFRHCCFRFYRILRHFVRSIPLVTPELKQ